MPSRFDYVKYDDVANVQQGNAKEAVGSVERMIASIGKGRAQSIALTKLEEVYMWIGKQIRDDQILRNGSASLQEERKDG